MQRRPLPDLRSKNSVLKGQEHCQPKGTRQSATGSVRLARRDIPSRRAPVQPPKPLARSNIRTVSFAEVALWNDERETTPGRGLLNGVPHKTNGRICNTADGRYNECLTSLNQP